MIVAVFVTLLCFNNMCELNLSKESGEICGSTCLTTKRQGGTVDMICCGLRYAWKFEKVPGS